MGKLFKLLNICFIASIVLSIKNIEILFGMHLGFKILAIVEVLFSIFCFIQIIYCFKRVKKNNYDKKELGLYKRYIGLLLFIYGLMIVGTEYYAIGASIITVFILLEILMISFLICLYLYSKEKKSKLVLSIPIICSIIETSYMMYKNIGYDTLIALSLPLYTIVGVLTLTSLINEKNIKSKIREVIYKRCE